MWTKVPKIPIPAEQVTKLLGLNSFRISEDGITYRTVKYLDVSDNHLVMEYIRGGASLGRILSRAGSPFASARQRQDAQVAVRLAGRWLKHFQAMSFDGPVECFDVPARLDQARLSLRELAARGLDSELAQQTERHLARAATSPFTQLVTPVHGDFKPDNLMIVPGEVIGIDMEGLHSGHPLIDLGQIMVHLFLSRSSAIMGAGAVLWWQSLEDEFLRGYGDDAESLRGIEFRGVESLLAVSGRLLRRRGMVFWRLRALPLFTRTLRHFLDRPVKGRAAI